MSEENVELTYRAFDAFNRRDFDALVGLMDDDVENLLASSPFEGSYHVVGGSAVAAAVLIAADRAVRSRRKVARNQNPHLWEPRPQKRDPASPD